MGWIPDLPDPRDYTFRSKRVLPLLTKLKRDCRQDVPDEVDLRYGDDGQHYFTEPKDQGPLNSSAPCAVLSLVEYFERRVRGRTFEGSRLFLYKVARDHRTTQPPGEGDVGADLRTTLKVVVSFGVPPEQRWPYDVRRLNDEPTSFLYALAKPKRRARYFRLDERNRGGASTWTNVISFLAAGFPVAFGFPVPTSLGRDAEIPYRPDLDGIRGGQSVVAVGYRKHHYGRGRHALRVRSSWGNQWGDEGNGWLPMPFIINQLARDFWTLIRKDWLNSHELLRPSVVGRQRMR